MHLPYNTGEELQLMVDVICGDRDYWELPSELTNRIRTWNHHLYWLKESAGSFNAPDYAIRIYRRGETVDAFYVCHDREDEAMVLLASRYPQALEWPEN
ncbi:hypothetical protein PBI_GRAYSON_238 [Rhodococcus phage Grayson]|nr:hypothetical protein PBI_GRAYSON_238 [Rhodococcus phage Grayson]